jgi:acyl-CoA thioesterase
MAVADGTTHFDTTTEVRAVEVTDGGGRFRAELDPSWASLRGIHGGYATATLVRAVEAILPGRDVRTVTSAFLRPSEAGPGDVDVAVHRTGRSLATATAVLRQGGREAISARMTLRTPVEAPTWAQPVHERPPALADCVPFVPPPHIRHFEQAVLLIDPDTPVDASGTDARVAGHVRPLEPRPIDAAWLVMIGDWFPPSPFRRLTPPEGGVSIDYAVHVHRTLPADPDRWLEGVFHTQVSEAGIALEHGVIATPDGMPIAETFHTRWTG